MSKSKTFTPYYLEKLNRERETIAQDKDFLQADAGQAGLYIKVSKTKLVWVHRYALHGKTIKYTFKKPYPILSLAAVRKEVADARDRLAAGEKAYPDAKGSQASNGIDPKKMTIIEATELYFSRHKKRYAPKSKEPGDIRGRMERWVVPVLGKKPVKDYTFQDMVDVLENQLDKPPTLKKVAGNLKNILAAYRAQYPALMSHNPAIWDGGLKEVYGDVIAAHNSQSHWSVPVDKAPALFNKMMEIAKTNRVKAGVMPYALLFTMLTGARTQEVIGRIVKTSGKRKTIDLERTIDPARWSEIDWHNKLWTIPGSRMKMGYKHIVPLCDTAMDILRAVAERTGKTEADDFIFQTHLKDKYRRPLNGGRPSDAAMSKLFETYNISYDYQVTTRYQADQIIHRAPTVHGMRKTLTTFCVGAGFDFNLASLAISHKLPHVKVDASFESYFEDTLVNRRIPMMDVWADYLRTGNYPDGWDSVKATKAMAVAPDGVIDPTVGPMH